MEKSLRGQSPRMVDLPPSTLWKSAIMVSMSRKSWSEAEEVPGSVLILISEADEVPGSEADEVPGSVLILISEELLELSIFLLVTQWSCGFDVLTVRRSKKE